MGEKSIYDLFESAVKKWQKIKGNPLKECKLNVLSQFTIGAKDKDYLDKWVVKIEEFLDYSLMYHVGLRDDMYFYREHPVLGDLDIGDFYKKIEVKDDRGIHVKKIKDFKDEEIERILEALDRAILRRGKGVGVEVPFGFFMFQFQALYSNKGRLKEKVETLIVKADIPSKAIIQFKEILKKMAGGSFREFYIFYENRSHILEILLNKKAQKDWLSKKDVLKAEFQIIS